MLYIFLAGILWGGIGLFVKELSALGASPDVICTMRMISAFVIMFAFAFIKHGKRVILTDKKALFFCALLGIISNGLFNIFYTASIKINGMGIACVLMYTAPVFTAAASRLIFREKFSGLKIFALTLNIAGCIMTVTGGNLSLSALNFTGLLMGLGSGFGYGMAAVFGRLAGSRTDSVITSMYSYFFASIFLCVFLRPDFVPVIDSAKILGWGFLYGLIPTALAYLIYYDAVSKIHDTSRVPVIASIEPVTAVLLGLLLYGENLGLGNFAGMIVVLVSIALTVKAE